MTKDISKNEKYFMKWFRDHGYEIKIKKQWNSKTVFIVKGQGLDFEIELISGVEDIKKYMKMIEMDLEMRKELQKLRKKD